MPLPVLVAMLPLLPMNPPTTPGGLPKAPEAVVSVFCYHHVQPRPDNYIALTPGLLEQQLQRIQRMGLPMLTAGEVAGWLQDRRNRGKRAVCLTFDDGNITVRTRAWPLLRRYGARATLFIHPRAIGTRGKMTWAQLGEMARGGVDVQCHGMTHESLLRGPRESPQAFAARMEHELGASKRQLERFTGKPITAFAFPFGWHQAEHLPLLRKLGYTAAFTVNEGVNGSGQHPMLLKRQSVFRRDTAATLEAKLTAVPATATALHPPDLGVIRGDSVALEARVGQPCDAMWLDFRRVPLKTGSDGKCWSGPYALRPGFHTVAIRSRGSGGQGMTSWSFLSTEHGKAWRHPGRPWVPASRTATRP